MYLALSSCSRYVLNRLSYRLQNFDLQQKSSPSSLPSRLVSVAAASLQLAPAAASIVVAEERTCSFERRASSHCSSSKALSGRLDTKASRARRDTVSFGG